MAANQDLVAMITELYNNVGGPVGYNNYCITMGMLETIKAKSPNVVMGQQQQQQQPAPAVAIAQNVWARSRNNGRFLLVLTIEQDSFPPQQPLNRERRTRVTRTRPQDRGETSAAGASRAIGGASGSTGPRERGETSAAGASRARHETSARGSLGNQLRSTRVLRSATREDLQGCSLDDFVINNIMRTMIVMVS
ncbi:hypothetical protein H5410_064444 [Solanum commersonii]|uniref:Uncharacterized protein n=1 Tax=Solanum commersonii TaxID=4109 RepID=A0A9J5W030_SOLCO|nr:hypothetical protein H5410_064444 [Solanum commersonii]